MYSAKNGKELKNSGFVLLSVLFSVTLLLSVAVAFAWFAKTEITAASSEAFLFESRCAARTACDYAVSKIKEDKNGYDSETELLYSPLGGLALDLGNLKVTVKIRPLNDLISTQGLFLPDGNTLRSEYEQPWKNLWDELKRPELAQIMLDFMDKDSEQRLSSVEQKDFLNRPVFDLCEFKLIKEVDDTLLYGNKKKKVCLKQFISPYGSDKININCATAEALSVLSTGLSFESAKSVVAARSMKPFKKTAELKSFPGFPAEDFTKLSNILSVESTHFELDIKVAQGKRERNFRAIVKRGGKGLPLRWEE